MMLKWYHRYNSDYYYYNSYHRRSEFRYCFSLLSNWNESAKKKKKKKKNFVSEPITIIIGAPDLYVNKGSTINLTCVVKYAPEPPPMMIWSHNSEVSNSLEWERERQGGGFPFLARSIRNLTTREDARDSSRMARGRARAAS